MEELLLTFLKDQATHGGGTLEKIIAFVVCWTFVKRGMKDHLSKIESGLTEMSSNLKKLTESLTRIEQDHSKRLDDLESTVTKLSDKTSSKGEA